MGFIFGPAGRPCVSVTMFFSCACLSRCAPSASRLTCAGGSSVVVVGIWAATFRRFRGGKCASTSAAIVVAVVIYPVRCPVRFRQPVIGRRGSHETRSNTGCPSLSTVPNPRICQPPAKKLFFAKRRFPRGLVDFPGAAVRRAVPSSSRSESANSARLSSTGDASRTEPPHRAPPER